MEKLQALFQRICSRSYYWIWMCFTWSDIFQNIVEKLCGISRVHWMNASLADWIHTTWTYFNTTWFLDTLYSIPKYRLILFHTKQTQQKYQINIYARMSHNCGMLVVPANQGKLVIFRVTSAGPLHGDMTSHEYVHSTCSSLLLVLERAHCSSCAFIAPHFIDLKTSIVGWSHSSPVPVTDTFT